MIFLEQERYREEAEALSLKSGLKITENADDLKENSYFLCYGEDGLSLSDGKLKMRGDFTQMASRLKRNNLQGEMLVKAVRMKNIQNLRVFDATAGMGEDSILLAASGFQVTLFEYNPIICALLRDAMKRAMEVPELQETIQRMTLVEGDSVLRMKELEAPNVIVLDPMFPERQKSALIKKKFQLLHYLEQPCSNEEELLSAAIACQPGKVVIKRPLKGPYLAGRKPDYSMTGKAIRYDCMLIHS